MDVLGQGLVLMLAGMGIVFIFLALLILTTIVSMKGISRFNHILPEDAPRKKPAPKANDDENVALAIAVALNAR